MSWSQRRRASTARLGGRLTHHSILFVHGLQGHPKKTWQVQRGPPPRSKRGRRFSLNRSPGIQQVNESDSARLQDEHVSPPTFWPEDLLPNSFPQARIMTWGYDSQVTRAYKAVGQGNTSSHARNLMCALEGNRPVGRGIIFVCHSYGGIIVKEASG